MTICAACRESLRAEHAVGLYNELLLKDRAGVPTHLQNAYMRAAAAALCNWRVCAPRLLTASGRE